MSPRSKAPKKSQALKASATTEMNSKEEEEEASMATSEASLDVGACCLCHCALDYSDKAAFYEEDRHEDYEEDDDDDDDSYYFRKNDPYLPTSLYDASNALVYCDSCDRMYHQKCHFVPITVLPRGAWHCLVCQTLKDTQKTSSKNVDTQQATELLQTRLFQSPPDTAVHALEVQWEDTSKVHKATLQHQEFRRLQQACKGQLGNYRQAATALEALTMTRRNRKHVSNNSQELAQTMCRLFGAKYKLRQACLQLESIRQSSDKRWRTLQSFCDDADAEFVQRVIFPFGREHPRRLEPRTPELQLVLAEKEKEKEGTSGGVPSEIVVSHGKSKADSGKAKTKHTRTGANTKGGHKKPVAAAKKKKKKDDDSGISLDNLMCCVCHKGTATDENDLILCDGSGCYRAYHMKCCKPAVTPEDVEDENDDWFCPLCSGLADLLHLIQSEYMGDEWDQRRYALQLDGKPTDGSVKSWDGVDQVFPDSEWQYEAACQLKEGKKNAATNKLLAQVLGMDHVADADQDDDDDDVEEDGHFDLDAFHQERQLKRQEMEEQADDENSSHSSQATLVEMSSVELEIGKDELAALSDPDSEDDESESDQESDSDSDGPVRKSRRLRKRASEAAADTSDSDPGKLDEANIVKGKRDRKPVDYRKLNDAIFGDLSEGEVAKIDDVDDFVDKGRKTSSTEDDQDDSNGSENDESESSETDGSRSEAEEEKEVVEIKEPPEKQSRKRAASSKGSRKQEPPRKKAKKQASSRKSSSSKPGDASAKAPRKKDAAKSKARKSKPVAVLKKGKRSDRSPVAAPQKKGNKKKKTPVAKLKNGEITKPGSAIAAKQKKSVKDSQSPDPVKLSPVNQAPQSPSIASAAFNMVTSLLSGRRGRRSRMD